MQSDRAVNCSYVWHFRSGRVCTEDCFVGDLFLKKGVQILIQIFTIHHNPEVWSDPEKFDPDRYAWSGTNYITACYTHCSGWASVEKVGLLTSFKWRFCVALLQWSSPMPLILMQ